MAPNANYSRNRAVSGKEIGNFVSVFLPIFTIIGNFVSKTRRFT